MLHSRLMLIVVRLSLFVFAAASGSECNAQVSPKGQCDVTSASAEEDKRPAALMQTNLTLKKDLFTMDNPENSVKPDLRIFLDENTKFISGVPIFHYHQVHHNGGMERSLLELKEQRDWNIQFAETCTDQGLKQFCESAVGEASCVMMGHPSAHGLAFVELLASEEELKELLIKHVMCKIDFCVPNQPISAIPELDAQSVDGNFLDTRVATWGIDRIDARSGLDGKYSLVDAGSGVTVHVADTGVRCTHHEFGGRCIKEFDYTGGGNRECSLGTPCPDNNGHGTLCAGTIAGKTMGVAAKAQIVSHKVLDDNGMGYFSGALGSLDFVMRQTGPRIYSASFGEKARDAVALVSVYLAFAAGVVVAASAGNQAEDACQYTPAFIPLALTAAASDKYDNAASFSNYGSCVNVYAPGVDIISAGSKSDTEFRIASGTSLACPHVSGAAAVIWGENASLTPAQIFDKIVEWATPDKITGNTRGSPNQLLYVETGMAGSAPPCTFAIHQGPGQQYCSIFINQSMSTGQADCESKCCANALCKYYSLWDTNWCMLSSECGFLETAAENTITVYKKQLACTMPIYQGPGENFCSNILSQSMSAGQADCESKCCANVLCKYFSLWDTNWCRLSSECGSSETATGATVTIYQKEQEPPCAHDTYQGPGANYCSSVLSQSMSSGPSDCELKCCANSLCKYYSFWDSKWCRLSSECGSFEIETLFTVTIYKKRISAPNAGIVPGHGWCLDGDGTGKEGTARKFVNGVTNCNSVREMCGLDNHCVAYACPSTDNWAIVYTSTNCARSCQNTSWLANPTLIARAGYIPSQTQWATASCYVKSTAVLIATTTTTSAGTFTIHVGYKFCLNFLDQFMTAGKADCELQCSGRSDCNYYSIWPTGWCRLSNDCSDKISHGEAIIYKKNSAYTTSILVGTFAIHEEYKFCLNIIYQLMTSGKDDCESKCSENLSCSYYSIWSTGWCRLSTECSHKESHLGTTIYRKLAVPTGSTFLLVGGFAIHEENRYCMNFLEQFMSAGKGDCESKCSTHPYCSYYSIWSTGWCRLSTQCIHKASHHGTTIYEKQADKYCLHVLVQLMTAGKDACESECSANSLCSYYSIWPTGWCRLSSECAQKASHLGTSIYQRQAASSASSTTTTTTTATTLASMFSDNFSIYDIDKYCDTPIDQFMTAGKDACESECLANSFCSYYSIWSSGWCRLSNVCSVKLSSPGTTIYESQAQTLPWRS